MKSTLAIVTITVTIVILTQKNSVNSSPLFFDFFKNSLGGEGGKNNNHRPTNSVGHNAFSGGAQYMREKKFPWDIFGIFGYKNVIRPTNNQRPIHHQQRPTNQFQNQLHPVPVTQRPNFFRPPTQRPTNFPTTQRPNFRPPTQRPTNFPTTQRPNFRPTLTGRPNFFPDTTTWPNNCNCDWSVVSDPSTGRPILVGTQQQTQVVRPLQSSIVVGTGVAQPPQLTTQSHKPIQPAQQFFPALPTYFPTLPPNVQTTTENTNQIETVSLL
jgi:hypothetical protein